ncbi:MAG: hypothetical protein DRP82_05595 [Planctomycetota bacterium]|nr:MAG: hypothetical protein DRP82_05595 [Planctomycetota bacterium]
MGANDMKITVRVRGVLARHWIDNMLVSVMTRRGVVHLGGRLHKITAVDEYDDINEDELATIEQEIRRIKGVKRVIYNIEGWLKDGGRFVKVETVHKQEKGKKDGKDGAEFTSAPYESEE